MAEWGAAPIIRRSEPTGNAPVVSSASVPPVAGMAKSFVRQATATRLRPPMVQSIDRLIVAWLYGSH